MILNDVTDRQKNQTQKFCEKYQGKIWLRKIEHRVNDDTWLSKRFSFKKWFWKREKKTQNQNPILIKRYKLRFKDRTNENVFILAGAPPPPLFLKSRKKNHKKVKFLFFLQWKSETEIARGLILSTGCVVCKCVCVCVRVCVRVYVCVCVCVFQIYI